MKLSKKLSRQTKKVSAFIDALKKSKEEAQALSAEAEEQVKEAKQVQAECKKIVDFVKKVE